MAKLAVSLPNELAEREANEVTERIMSSSGGDTRAPVQRRPGINGYFPNPVREGQPKIFRQAVSPGSTPTSPAALSNVLRSPGQALDRSIRQFFERRLEQDFSDVRVHTDAQAAASAEALGARAYAVGSDLVFAAGQFRQETSAGRSLLAHELTHVVQVQGAAKTGPVELSAPGHPLEREADRIGQQAASPTGRTSARMLFRQPMRDLRKIEPFFPYQWYEYIELFGEQLKRDLRSEMQGVSPPTGSRFINWFGGSQARFLDSILRTLLVAPAKSLKADLDRYLTAAEVAAAVELGREVGPMETNWFGGKDYYPEVALELRAVLMRRLTDSLNRIAPRYLAARNQAALSEQVRTGKAPPIAPEPDADAIILSAPIDRLVAVALCAGTVAFDLEGYRAAHPEERRRHELQALRTIKESDWRFEAVQGLWSWIHVAQPPGATVEEVAKLLYGQETQSHLIIAAPPYFGFDPDRLQGSMRTRWESLAGRDDDDIQERILTGVPSPKAGQPATTLQHGYDPSRKAEVELLCATQADEIVLLQARNLQPTGVTRDQIVTRLAISLKLLKRAAADAKLFQVELEPAPARLQARLDALKALVDPQVARKWDAQSVEQLVILQGAMRGMHGAATEHATIEKGSQNAGTPAAAAVFFPIIAQIGKAYGEAAQISELVVTAREKLDQADARAKRLPLDLADARLRNMRGILAHAEINKLHPEQRYSQSALESEGVAGLSRDETRLRHQIAEAREQMATDAEAALRKLKGLGPALDHLELGVQLTGIVDRIVELLATTLDAYKGSSGLAAIVDSGEYKVEMARILVWGKKWLSLRADYRAGRSNTREFKSEFRQVAQDPEWKQLFQSVLSRLSDLKQREAWINFGAKLAALVAIAIVTAGAGAIAEGAGLGFWTTAGVEALTFTALTLPFEQKATVQGFFLHLFENWVTFGIVKGATALYEAAVGEKFAKSLLGKGLGGVTSFSTATATMIAQAELEIQVGQGRALTAGEIKSIVGESTAVTLATLLAARYARPFLVELHVRGDAFRTEFDRINDLRVENAALAEIVKETKSLPLAQKLAEADGKVAEIEGEVLEKLSQDGANAKDRKGQSLSAEQQTALAELTHTKPGETSALQAARSEHAGSARARTLVEMSPMGPDLFVTEPGKDIIDFAKRFAEAGAEVVGPEYNADGSRSILVDFKDGHPFEVMETASDATRIMEPAGSAAASRGEPATTTAAQQAGEVAPEIQAIQQNENSATKQVERAEAERIEKATTAIPPEERRAIIKRQGERLLKLVEWEEGAKVAETRAIRNRLAREERKIANRERDKSKARADDPTKQKRAPQVEAEVKGLEEDMRKFRAFADKLENRLTELQTERERLAELKATAKRMIDGRETETLPCFPPGTPVSTPEGDVPIETLQEDARVHCWDENRKVSGIGRITQLHRHRAKRLYRLRFSSGEVEATGDHRFWVNEAGWTAARDLRAGMRIQAWSGSALIERIDLIEIETLTYNLSVEPHPTYFAGPGLLVHNAAAFHLGNIFIYEGYNPNFPDLIYIGQTNDLKGREEAHNREGREGLTRKFLSNEERLFFEFKSGMKLRPRLSGLNELTADYFEQVNKDWESAIRGDDKVMNRIEIVAKKNWKDVVKNVTELYCP